jgi:hypothetical protein
MPYADKTTFLSYDDWNPIREYDASSNVVTANIYEGKTDEIIGCWDAAYGGTTKFHIVEPSFDSVRNRRAEHWTIPLPKVKILAVVFWL